MATSPWSVTKLNLWAFVEVPLPGYSPVNGTQLPDNVVEYPAQGSVPRSFTEVLRMDVLSFQSDWSMNTIPTGSIQVAVGRRGDNPSLVAQIHDLVDDLKVLLRCQVWMHVMERSNSESSDEALDPWPEEPFVCFDGYICGSGFRKARSAQGNEVGFKLDLVHWLVDLNFSSALSRTSHQLNPSHYSFPAAFRAGTGVSPAFVASTLPHIYFAAGRATRDMWGLSLLPWLKNLCQQDRFNAVEIPAVATNPVRGKNFEALRALNRIEPFNSTHTTGAVADALVPEYEFGVKLELAMGEANTPSVVRAMGQTIGAETADTMSSHTLWDKIVSQYGPQFLFSLVPMVDRALIVPVTPGLRTWYKTIYATEHDAVDFSAKLSRPLRGVGVFTNLASVTGAHPTRPGGPPVTPTLTQRIGGYYENAENRSGMVVLKQGPSWLTSVGVPYSWGTSASAPNGTRGTATNPGAGTASAVPRPATLHTSTATLWQRFAQSLYVMKVLEGRGGTIKSRLRLDIAPGSAVRVVTAREKFVAAELHAAETTDTFGTVVRVSIVANSESMQAGTIFHIGYTRSLDENTSPSYSTYRHPLWRNIWDGAPLIGNHEEFSIEDTGGRMFGTDDPEVIETKRLLTSGNNVLPVFNRAIAGQVAPRTWRPGQNMPYYYSAGVTPPPPQVIQ